MANSRSNWPSETATADTSTATVGSSTIAGLLLVAILSIGAVLRLALLRGPFGEIEADEAIIGLMARHVLNGERPVFYWGQPYLGSIEAYLAAALFAVTGASGVALKLVPLFCSLAFILLIYETTRLAFGLGPALLSALYVGLPPAFLATWSIKARGGYVELLMLGQLILLIALAIGGRPDRWGVRWTLPLGILAGLSFWTHLLAVAYIAPAIGLLLLSRARPLVGAATAALIAGFGIGAAPLIAFNLANDLATWHNLFSGGFRLEDALANALGFVRHSAPVMVGLAQASSSPMLFAADFAERPGQRPEVAVGLALVGLAIAASYVPSVVRLLRRPNDLGALYSTQLLLIVATNLAAAVFTRFGELTSEPRYLMPLYSAVPLGALLIWRMRRWSPALVVAPVLLILGINGYSLVTADPRLNLPDHLGATTAATRTELAHFLESRGLTRVYTDYWLAYPLALETDERILPAVTSGGFNRYIPYAHEVAMSEAPAFVFVAGGSEEASFRAQLERLGASYERAMVAIYAVYYDVAPPSALQALR